MLVKNDFFQVQDEAFTLIYDFRILSDLLLSHLIRFLTLLRISCPEPIFDFDSTDPLARFLIQ